MLETTSKLFHRLRGRESGRELLRGTGRAPSCAQMLLEQIKEAGMSAAEWMAAADVSKSYGYQILRGERVPSRDILLRTALSLHLPLEKTQRLLTMGECGVLYPRVRRDAAIIFALNQNMTLLETEELLTSLPERSLYAGER